MSPVTAQQTESNTTQQSPKLSDTAIQCCLASKNRFTLALRQTTDLVQSALDLRSLSWPAPDFSTLRKRQLDLKTQAPHNRSQADLYLLTDSTGIKFLAEGEWTCKKHDPERRRQRCKLQTLQIRAFCMTINNASDACAQPDLLKQIPEDDALVSLKGDGTHDTPLVHEAVCSVVPFQSYHPERMLEPAGAASLTHRNAAIDACRRLRRGAWKRWSGHHRRSLVETK